MDQFLAVDPDIANPLVDLGTDKRAAGFRPWDIRNRRGGLVDVGEIFQNTGFGAPIAGGKSLDRNQIDRCV